MNTHNQDGMRQRHKRVFVDAPLDQRCTATITLKDGSAAQCGRYRKIGTLCRQHDGMGQQPDVRTTEHMSRKVSKTFDTSTLAGLKSAERYQARLYNLYDKVTVTPIGFNRVCITGRG